MREGTRQLLDKAEAALAAAKRDIEASAPDQAIVRAYYAAFHAATALLHEHGEHARTHSGIQHRFYKLFVQTGRLDVNLSRILVSLFQSRQEADYSFEAAFTIENAQDAVENASVLMDSVEAFIPRVS